MEKSLHLVIALITMFFALDINAQDSKNYTENLVVTVNGESSSPQEATITVETLANGNINFTLKNFKLVSEDGDMYVGNIALTDIALTDSVYCKTFAYNGNINITEGDDANAPYWLGPMIGEVPLVLKGKMTDNHLYVTIDIDMTATLEQIIYVKLGEEINPSASISSVCASTSKSSAVYNLSGSRVKNMAKGHMYIVNGKKIINKLNK